MGLGYIVMSLEDQPRHRDSRQKFLRVVGFLWVAMVCVTLIGALIAPHLGRVADFVLHQTVHRDWTQLTLRTAQPFFDLSVPEHTIKSYYSALYRSDAASMERLTAGSFREQMQQRVAHAEAAPGNVVYRSYLRTERSETHDTVVVEKFHLFWQQGLRFSLQRNAAGWRVAGVDLVR
jgi:hypothetical protein